MRNDVNLNFDPLFSIVTACLNSESNIQKTLASLDEQTFKNFEYVVVDGKSSDSTVQIVKQFAKRMHIKLISEPDENLSDAFNKGVKLSSGKWILFLGSGDALINDQVLEQVSRRVSEVPEQIIAWGNVVFQGKDGSLGARVSGDYKKSKLKIFCCYPHQGVFHNKVLFEKYGYFRNDIHAAMDYELFIRAYKDIDERGFMGLDISFWEADPNAISQGGNRAIKDFLKVQLLHKVWPKPFAYFLFYWALTKNSIKRFIKFDEYGLNN